ncbi:MAG: DUF1841 family protein [Candidatus Obscuribacterales bacterium]|nr:DUF1841 family protein [Steroidobacteraceae bacterium]
MPFFAQQSRTELRQNYLDVWRKHLDRVPMEAIEVQIAQAISEHPEYHSLLAVPDVALTRDFAPEAGHSNPFLHMSLHLAVRDQVSTDSPHGIRVAFELLARRRGAHDAEHAIIEHLAEMLWQAQRDGLPPNENIYLSRIKRLLRR